MKFLFDHDVPDDMAYGLTTLGHEVFKLRELIHPQTIDEEVPPLCWQKQLRPDHLQPG